MERPTDGLSPVRLVVLQILQTQRPGQRLLVSPLDDLRGDLALVDRTGTFLGEALESVGIGGILEVIAGMQRCPIGMREQLPHFARELHVFGEKAAHAYRHLEPLTRSADHRRKQILPRQRPELVVSLGEQRKGPGDSG